MLIDFTPPTPKLSLDFTDRVFMYEKTHSYILVESTKNHETFLRLGNGVIEAIKMGKASKTREELVPHKYDFYKAAKIFYASPLGRSSRIERILRDILGISTLDVVDDGEEGVIEDGAPVPEKQGAAYTLADLCQEIKMDPAQARKLLRGRIQKPDGGWRWATREEASMVRAILTDAQT